MSPPADGCCCFSRDNGDPLGNGSPDHFRFCTHCRKLGAPSCSSTYGIDSEKLWRVIVASAKGFSIGAGLKGGLALFSVLLRLRSKRSPNRKVEMLTNGEAVSIAVKETLRYGLFLGAFAGIFVSADEIVGAMGGHRRHDLDLPFSGSVGRSDCRAIHALDGVGGSAYQLDHIHSYVSCCTSFTLG